VDGRAEEDDALLQQQRIDIVRALAAVGGLDHHGHELVVEIVHGTPPVVGLVLPTAYHPEPYRPQLDFLVVHEQPPGVPRKRRARPAGRSWPAWLPRPPSPRYTKLRLKSGRSRWAVRGPGDPAP